MSEDLIAERAMFIRQEKFIEAVKTGELDPYEALLGTVAPPKVVLDWSITEAGMRPFAPRDFQVGDRCRHGHLRTEGNTGFKHEKRSTSGRVIYCKTCDQQKQRKLYQQNLEKSRALNRESYWRNKEASRERKNAQNRAWHQRNRDEVNRKKREKSRVAPADTGRRRKPS